MGLRGPGRGSELRGAQEKEPGCDKCEFPVVLVGSESSSSCCATVRSWEQDWPGLLPCVPFQHQERPRAPGERASLAFGLISP